MLKLLVTVLVLVAIASLGGTAVMVVIHASAILAGLLLVAFIGVIFVWFCLAVVHALVF